MLGGFKLQPGLLSNKRKKISPTLHIPDLPIPSDRLDLPITQLLQRRFIGMIRDEAMTVLLQPTDNVAPKRAAITIELDGIRLHGRIAFSLHIDGWRLDIGDHVRQWVAIGVRKAIVSWTPREADDGLVCCNTAVGEDEAVFALALPELAGHLGDRLVEGCQWSSQDGTLRPLQLTCIE